MDIWYFESRRRWERVGMGETNQRYTQLSKNTDIYILGDAPLVLLGRALLYDTKEDKIIGQLKFQSISEKKIIAFKISVIGFDVSNVQIEQSEFQYLDLKMKENDVTGSQTPIVFSNKNVRKFVFWISEIVYGDGSIENPSNHELILVEKKLISDVLDKELAEQYKRSLNPNIPVNFCQYVPAVFGNRVWCCNCGSINGIHRTKCYRCGSEIDNQQRVFNKEYLNAQLEEYKKEKELKNIEKEKIRQKQIKQLQFGTKIAVVVVAVLLVGNLGYKKIIVPHKQYNEAEKLMEQEDYSGAKKIYEQLGAYKDSDEQVEKIDNKFKQKAMYTSAMMFYQNNSESMALSDFLKCEGYGDSYYYIGMIKKHQRAYKEAISYFDKVIKDSEHYRDSISEKEECYYKWGMENVDKGRLDSFVKAKDELEKANGIYDSEKVLKIVKEELNKKRIGVYHDTDDLNLTLEIICAVYPKTLNVNYKILFRDPENRMVKILYSSEVENEYIMLNDSDGKVRKWSFSGDTITETYRLEGESWDDTELDNGRIHTYVKESDNS